MAARPKSVATSSTSERSSPSSTSKKPHQSHKRRPFSAKLSGIKSQNSKSNVPKNITVDIVLPKSSPTSSPSKSDNKLQDQQHANVHLELQSLEYEDDVSFKRDSICSPSPRKNLPEPTEVDTMIGDPSLSPTPRDNFGKTDRKVGFATENFHDNDEKSQIPKPATPYQSPVSISSITDRCNSNASSLNHGDMEKLDGDEASEEDNAVADNESSSNTCQINEDIVTTSCSIPCSPDSRQTISPSKSVAGYSDILEVIERFDSKENTHISINDNSSQKSPECKTSDKVRYTLH